MITNLLELLIFGSLTLLGILLLANPLKVNKKANVWFGLFLLIWASYWLEEIFFMVSEGAIELHSFVLLRAIQIFAPVFFFISIRYFTNPGFKPEHKGYLYMVMPLMYVILLFVDAWQMADLKITLIAFMFIHGLLYLGFSFLVIRNHKRHIQQFASNTLEIDLDWLENIVMAAIFLVVVFTVFNVLFFDAPLNFFMNGFAYLIVLFTAYHSLKQKEIYPLDIQERAEVLLVVNEADNEAIQNKHLSDDKLVEVKARLHDLITREELYLDSELNLGKLAKKLGVSSHHLSYVINNGYNQNFYGFINKFRVEKAKKLLAGKALDKYSIMGIAYESGFNSKTAFNTTFKKITGLTPSEFVKTSSGL